LNTQDITLSKDNLTAVKTDPLKDSSAPLKKLATPATSTLPAVQDEEEDEHLLDRRERDKDNAIVVPKN
jgi:hypothetical protein